MSGPEVTAFDTENVINLGRGVYLNGAASPFDVGLAFGAPGIGKDKTQNLSFLLTNSDYDLTLEDIAQVRVGAQVTSTASDSQSKFVVTAPAAPDAKNDTYSIFEDGQANLSSPSQTPAGIIFPVLTNDTDADNDTLTITDIISPSHGTVTIIDGPDADLLPGDALLYTPVSDYSGDDSFEYVISDNNGGKDFASVDVSIAAVADVPTLQLQASAVSGKPNQIRIYATASSTDRDESEYIDSLKFGPLPAGVSLAMENDNGFFNASTGIYNPETVLGTLEQDFILTLPLGQDQNFDLGFTAFAKENDAAGDEQWSEVFQLPIGFESQSVTQDIEYTALQNLWGLADEQSFDLTIPFYLVGKDLPSELGILPTLNEGFSSSILDGVVKFAGNFFLEAGLTFDFSLKGGTIDAESKYSLGLTTNYNETTDTLLVSSNKSLISSRFDTVFPSFNFGLDFFYDLDADLKVTLDGGDILGSETLTIFDEDVSGSETVLPEITVSDSLNLAVFAFPEPLKITIPGSPSVPNPLAGPFFVRVDWPDIDISAASSNNVAVGAGESEIILGLQLDVDKFLFPPLGLGFEVSKLGFGVEASLVDFDVEGGLSLNQEHTLTLQDSITGHLVLEDGSSFAYTIGEDMIIENLLGYDTNNDGEVAIQFKGRPLASFENDTDLGLTFLYDLEALTARASGPLGIGSASTTAFAQNGSVTPVDFDIFTNDFPLGFGEATSQSILV